MFETSNTVILSEDNTTHCIQRVFAMAYAMAIQSWLPMDNFDAHIFSFDSSVVIVKGAAFNQA